MAKVFVQFILSAKYNLPCYELLITPTEPHVLNCITEWERDLDKTFNTPQRRHILRFTYKSSICTKTQETNFKILTRWYRTPANLKKIFPDTSDQCWRCQGEKGTILHIFWSCPKLEHFWKEVHRILQKFTECEIPDNPAFFLLHASSIPGKIYKKSIICHLLDAAKACIPLK